MTMMNPIFQNHHCDRNYEWEEDCVYECAWGIILVIQSLYSFLRHQIVLDQLIVGGFDLQKVVFLNSLWMLRIVDVEWLQWMMVAD